MLTIIGTVAIVLACIGIGIVLDRKYGILPRKEKLLEQGRRGLALPGHAPGEAPSTALVSSDLAKLRAAKCTHCRGATDPLPDDRVTYDGVELVVLHARCRRCGRERSTYVRP